MFSQNSSQRKSFRKEVPQIFGKYAYKLQDHDDCSMKNQVNRPNEHQVTITLHMLSKGLQLCDTEFTDLKVS